MWSPKHSSLVCRLNGYSIEFSIPTTSVVIRSASAPAPSYRRKPTAAGRVPGKKPPEAKRRCTRRRATATSRLRSSFCRKAPRWTPRTPLAGASILRQNSCLPGVGHLQKKLGLKTLSHVNNKLLQSVSSKTMSFVRKMY